MPKINLTPEQRTQLTEKLREYLRAELDLEVGSFEADFLLEFIAGEFGAVYYNAGLRDAQAQLSRRVDDVLAAIDELEQATSFDR